MGIVSHIPKGNQEHCFQSSLLH